MKEGSRKIRVKDFVGVVFLVWIFVVIGEVAGLLLPPPDPPQPFEAEGAVLLHWKSISDAVRYDIVIKEKDTDKNSTYSIDNANVLEVDCFEFKSEKLSASFRFKAKNGTFSQFSANTEFTCVKATTDDRRAPPNDEPDFKNADEEDNPKRNLACTTDVSQTVVSGTGINDFSALNTVRVTVQAKDSSGVNCTSGGDMFYILITNECTKGDAFPCEAVSGAKTTITSDVNAPMVDNGDGTYHYDYSVNIDGKVTVQVILYKQGGLRFEFYSNQDYTGVPAVVQNQYWYYHTGGSPISYQNDYFSLKAWGLFYSNVTTNQHYYMYAYDGLQFYINTTTELNSCWTSSSRSSHFYHNMVSGQFYDIKIEMKHYTSTFSLRWYTYYPSWRVVPNHVLYYPNYIGSTPKTLTVTCPAGYTGSDPSSPTQWITVCGDGLRVGSEICDDGNNYELDGCAANCSYVYPVYTCSGGSSSQKDTCTDKCKIGYEVNPTHTECTKIPTSSTNRYFNLGVATVGLAFLLSILSLINTFYNKMANITIVSVIMQMQMILIIPVVDVYVSDEVMDF